ncbi:MAG: PAS domain-containing protein [Proteobacteria bacterium]|nr:PAS domain-containing protein [Pseudomonadota bacterium]
MAEPVAKTDVRTESGVPSRALDVARLRWVLLALVLLLGVAIGFVYVTAARSANERTVETTARQAAALARTLEAHAARSFGAADTALSAMIEALEGRGAFAGVDLQAMIVDRHNFVPGIHSIFWIDADGTVRLDSTTADVAPRDVSNATYFAAHRDRSGLGLYLSPPMADPDTGAPVLVMSRRLEDSQGNFAGVIAAALDTEYFRAYYATLDVGIGGSIALWSGDGMLLIREPHDPAMIGRVFVGQPLHRGLMTGLREQTHRVVSPLDGVARLQSWRRVADLPFVASIAYAEEYYMAPMRAALRTQLIAVGAGAAITLALAFLVWFQLGRYAQLDAERRAGIERLAQSRRQLRTVVDTVPAIINAKGPDGRYTLMNAYQAAVFGVHPRATIGKRVSDFVAQPLADEVEALERELVETGRAIRDHAENFPDASGRMRHFLTSKIPIFGGDGKVTQFVSVATDVTAIREMEAATRAAEARMRAAIESIPEGFAIYDESDRLIVANQPYVEMFAGETDPARIQGRTFEELVRMSVARGEPPEPGFTTEAWVAERVRRHREGMSGMRLLRIADGRTISVAERHVPGVGIVGIRTDVSQLVETEAALRNARDAAETANRAKSQFLANMSHELRTPLNAIIGFAEMIEKEIFGKVGSKRYIEYANDIAASGRHLVDLIGDVLDMSKIEAGRYALEEEPIELGATIDAAIAIARGQAHHAGVRLNAAGDKLRLRADGRALRQVLLNLLSNAIKFTPKGGRVDIAWRAADSGVEIDVVDTGIGIAHDELPHVIEPFRQAQGVGRNFGGTGLGLAITKRLVELHGGRLEIESQVGKGTRVRFVLPADRLLRDAA